MRHFIAYHNADRMGYSDIERLRVLTNRPVNDDMIGDHVWLVVGKGSRKKSYYLGSRFVIDAIHDSEIADFDYQLTGRDGRVFIPMIPLDELDWFNAFRQSVQNFSLGFREIKDSRVVQEFERLSAHISQT